jgi:hypothetical protein
MNPLKGRSDLKPEVWVIALAAALIAAVGGRWLSLAGASSPEPLIANLGRFASLASYFVATKEVMAEEPSLATASWPNPFDRPSYTLARAPATAGAGRVTAILISENRRLAIIGDRIVGVGDLLPGAGRVEAIEAGQVILRRDGRREILRLLPETQGR